MLVASGNPNQTVRSLLAVLIVTIGVENAAAESYEADWDSLARHDTPEWFEDAVLGIYFHWGVYSVPAFGCWGGRNMYQPDGGMSEAWAHVDKTKYANTYDYVKQVYGEPGTEFGYKDFIPMFKAEKWDPDAWAALFKEAGADFAGPVAIHHDGFAMWDSETAEYNAMDMGPKRDITGEMLAAVRRQGMKTFASFHGFCQWDFFNPGRILCPPGVDVNNPAYAGLYGPERDFKGGMWQEENFSLEYQQEWHDKCIEVIDQYCPDQVWFEQGFSEPENIGPMFIKQVLAHYFNTAAERGSEVVVTRKRNDLPLSCSVLDLEASQMDEAQPVVWQTDISLGTNHAWAYSIDAVSRPVDEVIDDIVDRKSKNGVTLLSLAPKADGTLPASQVSALKEIGAWMAVNKRALHGTSPAPFAEGGVDAAEAGSIRFTMKGNLLYAIDLERPEAPYVIPDARPLPESAITLLGADERLPWRMDGGNLVIESLPEPMPGNYAWSFAIQIK